MALLGKRRRLPIAGHVSDVRELRTRPFFDARRLRDPRAGLKSSL
jgi:hypothetical protein